MIFILIIAIFWLLFLTGIFYGFIFIVTLLTRIIIDKSETGSFRKTKQYNRISLPISIFLSIIVNCYYLFSNPAHNFKTAYIEKGTGNYMITIIGRRNLMAHDPISLFKKGTYIDSVKFEIPRPGGIIDGLEIPNNPGSYKICKGNAITINNKAMTVSLFYDNYDYKKIDPSIWNGNYELEWRTHE